MLRFAFARVFLTCAFIGVACFCVAPAVAGDVRIKIKTSHYSISGRKAAEFAAAMTRGGPYSRQHRRRVWATAGRTLSFQLVRKRRSKKCHIIRAKVFMNINYSMPKLRNIRFLNRRERNRWQRMYAILDRHEKTHGRFYAQLARETHRALMRLPAARSCRQLDAKAEVVVKKLSAKNKAKNDRFDFSDRRNYRRMERLYASL